VPTHYAGTDDEKRALNAFIALMRASDSVTWRLSPLLAKSELTVSQFGVLEALYHLGPLCQSELGRKILKSSGNVTVVVDNLEKRGLVRRERDTRDRRFVTVHLTDEGEELVLRVLPRHVRNLVFEFGVLSPSEQEELRRLCRKLGKREPA
jgi:MarR family 2-MHQ and catechol resistance regulon transcriptional repressor